MNGPSAADVATNSGRPKSTAVSQVAIHHTPPGAHQASASEAQNGPR